MENCLKMILVEDEGLANPKTKNEETLLEGFAERSSVAAVPV